MQKNVLVLLLFKTRLSPMIFLLDLNLHYPFIDIIVILKKGIKLKIVLSILALTTTLFANSLSDLHHLIESSYFDAICYLDNLTDPKQKSISYQESLRYKNQVTLISSFRYTKDHKLRPSIYLKGRVYIPNISRYFEIDFDKETNSRSLNQSLDKEFDQTISDSKTRISLLYNFIKKKNINLYAKLGTKIDKFEFYIKSGALKRVDYQNFSTLYDLHFYKYIFKNMLISSAMARVIKELNPKNIFENDLILTHDSRKNELYLDIKPRLYQQINNKSSMRYQLSYQALKDKQSVYKNNQYRAEIAYKYFLRDWFYIELIPSLIKAKEDHFKLKKELRINFAIKLNQK